MKVAIKRPYQEWEWQDINPDLKNIQEIVGGFIELVPNLYTESIMYCNEEGKILDLLPNIAIYENADSVIPFDVIRGPIVMFGPSDDEGNDTELSVDLFYKTLDIIEPFYKEDNINGL